MKAFAWFLASAVALYTLRAGAESLILTNGNSLEIGGTHLFDGVFISEGTVYLTNDTVITSSGDISILSGGTITWHCTTTNWATNIYLDSPGGRSGSGASVIAKNGTNAWNLTLRSTSNLTVNGTIDLRGGAGQTHIGNADQGIYGGDFYNTSERSEHKGGKGGSSYGGHGGTGARLSLVSDIGYVNLHSADIILSGGGGGNGGDGGAAGGGGDYRGSEDGQGADGGNGGDSFGGRGGNGGTLAVCTVQLISENFNINVSGGAGGHSGEGGDPDEPGYGWKDIGGEPYPWDGNSGGKGQCYAGNPGTNGTIDVIKQAEPVSRLENGRFFLDLDMTSTGAVYFVEYCTNLVKNNWQTIGTFTTHGGSTNWVDASSNRVGSAFYRIQTVY